MYKTRSELMEMSIGEIAKYIDKLENEDENAKNNNIKYQNWCMEDLDDVLMLKNISTKELQEYLK